MNRAQIKDKVRKLFLYVIFLVLWGYTRLQKGKRKTNNVIVFRLDLIGDCTMFTSAALAIRDYYKDRHITMVCLGRTRPVFERLGIFDDIISLDIRPDYFTIKQLIRCVSYVIRGEYDILLQPQVSKLPFADILAAGVRCNKRISIDTLPGNSTRKWIKYTKSLYDQLIAYPKGWRNELEYYSAFIRGIGIENYKIGRPFLPVKKQTLISGRYYVLYPGASWTQRAWEPEKFARSIDYIFKKTGYSCVILGSASELHIGDEISKKVKLFSGMSIINLMGKTSLSDVFDIIGNAQFVISNDTSGGHIAAATNTPAIVITGGGHLDRFFPYKVEHVRKTDNLPIAVHTRMDCFYCDWNWENIRIKNPQCLVNLRQELKIECVQNIFFSDIKADLDKILEKDSGLVGEDKDVI